MFRKLSLTLIALLFTVRCAQEAESKGPVADAPLPADVRAVAAAATTATESQAAPAGGAAVEPGLVAATGEFVSPSRSELAPKFPGNIAQVLVDEGAFVRRGQPVASLDTDYLRIEVQRAEAEMARVNAAAADARRDFERKKELRAKESIPQAAFDRSQSAYEQAEAGRAAAASAVALGRQRLSDAVLRAPITGVVAERRIDVGEHIGEAGVAFVIEQTAPLKLRFKLPERYLGSLRPGQTVVATVDPYPSEKFSGTIKTVGGVIDPTSRTLFAEAEFANADGRLRPGLFARVEMKID
jgi:RND family efflux transporter MFP subunit